MKGNIYVNRLKLDNFCKIPCPEFYHHRKLGSEHDPVGVIIGHDQWEPIISPPYSPIHLPYHLVSLVEADYVVGLPLEGEEAQHQPLLRLLLLHSSACQTKTISRGCHYSSPHSGLSAKGITFILIA